MPALFLDTPSLDPPKTNISAAVGAVKCPAARFPSCNNQLAAGTIFTLAENAYTLG